MKSVRKRHIKNQTLRKYPKPNKTVHKGGRRGKNKKTRKRQKKGGLPIDPEFYNRIKNRELQARKETKQFILPKDPNEVLFFKNLSPEQKEQFNKLSKIGLESLLSEKAIRQSLQTIEQRKGKPVTDLIEQCLFVKNPVNPSEFGKIRPSIMIFLYSAFSVNEDCPNFSETSATQLIETLVNHFYVPSSSLSYRATSWARSKAKPGTKLSTIPTNAKYELREILRKLISILKTRVIDDAATYAPKIPVTIISQEIFGGNARVHFPETDITTIREFDDERELGNIFIPIIDRSSLKSTFKEKIKIKPITDVSSKVQTQESEWIEKDNEEIKQYVILKYGTTFWNCIKNDPSLLKREHPHFVGDIPRIEIDIQEQIPDLDPQLKLEKKLFKIKQLKQSWDAKSSDEKQKEIQTNIDKMKKRLSRALAKSSTETPEKIKKEMITSMRESGEPLHVETANVWETQL